MKPSKTTVDHIRKKGKYISEEEWAYIGRPSIFGNPFWMANEAQRREVVKMYRDYFHKRIKEDKEFLTAVASLRGRALLCYCAPKSCHGDIIAEYLNQEVSND